MRAILLTVLALLAAGCAGDPQEAQDSVGTSDQCVEDASAYHEAGTGGAASSDPPPEPVPPTQRMGGPYCPDELGAGAGDTSTKESTEER